LSAAASNRPRHKIRLVAAIAAAALGILYLATGAVLPCSILANQFESKLARSAASMMRPGAEDANAGVMLGFGIARQTTETLRTSGSHWRCFRELVGVGSP
jgi:hypothetical protein